MPSAPSCMAASKLARVFSGNLDEAYGRKVHPHKYRWTVSIGIRATYTTVAPTICDKIKRRNLDEQHRSGQTKLSVWLLPGKVLIGLFIVDMNEVWRMGY